MILSILSGTIHQHHPTPPPLPTPGGGSRNYGGSDDYPGNYPILRGWRLINKNALYQYDLLPSHSHKY